ncbi:TMV resistance protein N-like isoform X3 [Vigna unguiculata]|uniref:TMV resistance protein N-like isoform X3 n=1 Tax=Vigna unguiculata TaxID=3917 RepID=UPI0010171BCC|nr:TMV resistance protein N-like isoform X3 [Vigna unguiculata]
MACPGGATHSPKLQISLDGMRAITVGLQSHVEDAIQIIKNKSSEVCRIGICGMGGSGKTTLAKAIYNQIQGTFMEKSFIEDIAQVTQTRGRVHLLEQLLHDVLKTNVDSVQMGRSMIRERLYGKRVLIVLDDVNEYFCFSYMNEYGPLDLWNSPWFGKGTVIIITTRDAALLTMEHVYSIIRINEMNPNASLKLLSWHAFREAKPKEEYHLLAKRVVDYCGGLPLTLEVIGSYLYERSIEEWTKVLSRLENIPQHEVPQILKIGFDGLRNQMEKYLFLDICCFFVGKDRTYVTKILNGCGVDPDSGIRVLIECSLIKVTKNNKFGVHPLLQDMGREVIREISRKEPRKNIELVLDKDTKYALLENTLFSSQGTNVIQGLSEKRFLTSTGCFKPYSLQATKMLKFIGDSEYVSKKLRWFILRGFPLEYLPNDFYLHDAIAIDLKHNLLRFVWKQPQVLTCLKVLNLSHSRYLQQTPDFSRLPSLEQLILKDCPRLREVHHSIGCLCYLTLLNLKDCTSLINLTIEIYKLKSLKILILSGCSKVSLLEKDIVQMESLITLIAESTAVKEVPFSIVSSKSIGYISLRGFQGLSHNLLPSIIRSWMLPTMKSLSYIHSFCMDMEDNSWDDIAPLLSTLVNLRSVLVQCNTEFQLSKQVETILNEYSLNITKSGTSTHHLKFSLIGVGRCKDIFNAISDSISEALASSKSSVVSLPGDNDPDWLAHIGEGPFVSFTVPQDCEVKGMALCVVYLSTPGIVTTEYLTSVLIVNYTKCTLQIHNHGTVISFNDKDWEGIISNLGSGDKVEIFYTFNLELVIKNTAVYLIYGETNDLEKEFVPKKKSLIRFMKKSVM